jgi:hypothetical protein
MRQESRGSNQSCSTLAESNYLLKLHTAIVIVVALGCTLLALVK